MNHGQKIKKMLIMPQAIVPENEEKYISAL